MAKRTFKAGATSQTIDIFVQDSSSTIGAGLSGLAFGTAGLKCYYRKGATGSATAVTLATQTVGGAWSSGGFVEIDATNMKGVYRFDVPDTVLASAGWALVYFYGAANMAPVVAELEIVSYDPFDAAGLGLSRLDAAMTTRLAPTTAGRTLDVSTTGEAGVDWANVGSPSTAVSLSATTINLVNTLTTYTGNTPQTGDAFARIGATGSGLTSLAPAATALTNFFWTDGRAVNLDRLDATVSSRMPTTLYSAPLDAAGTRAAVGLASANLDSQLAAVKTDTAAALTRLPAALTAGGNMKSDTLYQNGRIWIDTGSGAAGTTSYVHGTVTNPNSSLANARTIANALNLTAFQVRNNSNLTLDQGYTAFSFFGERWTLALANRAISNCHFEGADVSGLSSGTNTEWTGCLIGTATIADGARFAHCGLNGTLTTGSAGNFIFAGCFSNTVAGTDTVIDFAAVGATTVALRDWNGGLEVRNMAAGDVLLITGEGNLTIAASCTAGAVYLAGALRLVNSGSGQTLTDAARWSEDQSVASVTGSVGSVVAGVVLTATGADLVLVDGKTLPVALQIIAALCAGKVSGAGSGVEVFKGIDGATTRATVTVDASGNRSSIVYA